MPCSDTDTTQSTFDVLRPQKVGQIATCGVSNYGCILGNLDFSGSPDEIEPHIGGGAVAT